MRYGFKKGSRGGTSQLYLLLIFQELRYSTAENVMFYIMNTPDLRSLVDKGNKVIR